MKASIISLFCLLSGLWMHGFAQSAIEIKTNKDRIYFADDAGNYFLPIEASRDIRVGDFLDGVDALGHRMTLKVTKVRQENGDDTSPVLAKGSEGSLDVHDETGGFRTLDYDFYLVEKGAPYPGQAAASAPATTSPAQITATLNGQPWSADVAYQGALFYAKGVQRVDPSGKPFLQLAFKANTAPDQRQITLQVRNFAARNGNVPAAQQEWLLTGSVTGDASQAEMCGYKADPAYSRYSVTFTVTAWEQLAPDRARLSATFSAKLKGVLGGRDVTLTDGKVNGIEVVVYPTAQ